MKSTKKSKAGAKPTLVPQQSPSSEAPLRSNWRELVRRMIEEHASRNKNYRHGTKPSLRRYSLELGTNPTLVWEWLYRDPPKEPQFGSIAKLMTVLEKPISLLVDETNVVEVSPPVRVPVVGMIEAGAWREPVMLDVLEDSYVPAVIDPRYVRLKQRAWIVKGTSLSRVALDGDVLITVSFHDLDREPRDGELVICERHQHGLLERTAKRYRIVGSRVRLDPDSDDPKYQTPVWMPEDEGGDEEVVVKAEHLVISMIRALA